MLIGLVLVVLGTAFVAQGVGAKDLITSALAAQEITTGDGAAIPNAPVVTAATAQA